MTVKRIVPLLLAFLLFAVTANTYSSYIMWAGFRDGFMSELDRAETMLASYFVWFSLALGLWLLVVSFLASRFNVWKQLLIVGALFVLVTSAVIGIDLHFRTYMVDSAGG